MYEWQPDLPKPASENWRKAYGSTTDGRSYTPSDSQAKTAYQALSGGKEKFLNDTMRLPPSRDFASAKLAVNDACA